MKVLILVLCYNREDYNRLEQTIKETWGKSNDKIDVVYYHASTSDYENGNDIYFNCTDTFFDITKKTLKAFEWSLDKGYDYIFRTNLGSYIHKENLLKFLQDKPSKEFYCGITGTDNYYYGIPIRFASGSGYFLSSDLVKLVVDNKHKFNHNCVDDVELGKVLYELGIEPKPGAFRHNICDGKIYFEVYDKEVKLSDMNFYSVYHYRLRSTDREGDINMMREIHSKFN